MDILEAPDHKVVPSVHLERVLCYDKLGQVSVAGGTHDVAKQAFSKVFACVKYL